MTWALSTETAQSKKKRKRNPEILPSICLESLNVFASKTIKGLFVLFPSAKSTCGFIGFHSWDNRGNVSSKKKKSVLFRGRRTENLLCHSLSPNP